MWEQCGECDEWIFVLVKELTAFEDIFAVGIIFLVTGFLSPVNHTRTRLLAWFIVGFWIWHLTHSTKFDSNQSTHRNDRDRTQPKTRIGDRGKMMASRLEAHNPQHHRLIVDLRSLFYNVFGFV